jgi:hypothetical protein
MIKFKKKRKKEKLILERKRVARRNPEKHKKC